MSTDTSVLDRPETKTGSGKGDMAHIADKDRITEAYINGTAITALCGYTWVPSKSPKGLPVCQECKDLAEIIWGNNSEKIGF